MANRYPLQQPQMHPNFDMPVRNNVPSLYSQPRPSMWPHHSVHPQLAEEQNEKQREYLKQQQKLRLMTATSSPQPVNADALIENLLGKKETFKLKSHPGVQSPIPSSSQQILGTVGPGLIPGQLNTTIRPPVSYPVPPTLSQVQPALPSGGMTGSYGAPILPLEAKQTYTPTAVPSASRIDMNMATQAHCAFNLPAWLTPTSPMFPQFYHDVWKLVGLDKGLVDTNRIFPILLTSGLPTDVLGFIWGLANRKVAGQLTEQELYIVLSLVALAQSGCTFNNLSVLNLIPQPPIPNLKIAGFDSMNTMPVRDIDSNTIPIQGRMKREDLNLSQISPVTHNQPSFSKLEEPGFDDFTEFQSAPEPNAVEHSITKEVPSVSNLHNITKEVSSVSRTETTKPPLNISNSMSSSILSAASVAQNTVTENSAIKCPSVMVVSSGHGRGIGSRLANHSLGTPKQRKSKHHHHHHHHRSHLQMIPNIPAVSVDEDFSEFQQAKEPVLNSCDVLTEEMFPRCNVKPLPQGKTFLLKESAIRSEMKPENFQPTKEEEAVKDSNSLFTLEVDKSNFDEKNKTELFPDKPNVSSVKIKIEPETSTPVAGLKNLKVEGVNLMSVEEDKYSALRNLTAIDQDKSPDGVPVPEFTGPEISPASDEFGDFLSAEPAVQITDDLFADIASREHTAVSPIVDGGTDVWKTLEAPQVAEFQVDDWGDFKEATNPESGATLNVSSQAAEQNVVSENDNIEKNIDISAAFMNLDLNGGINWNQSTASNFVESSKDKSQILPSNDLSNNLNLIASWDNEPKEENGKTHSSKPETSGHNDSFQGFLGKIYDIKRDQNSAKTDFFCSSPEIKVQSTGETINYEIDLSTHDCGEEDEFGDFVGPDTWGEDQKNNLASKDMLFEGQFGGGLKDGFYTDTQSVSSLELPPLALSRHGSVPSLDLKIFASATDKSSGSSGNQLWDLSPQGIEHLVNEWERCIHSCLTLLQSAVEMFNSISNEEVLNEVVGSAEGKDYLQNILEVAGVCHRVQISYRHMTNTEEYKSLDPVLKDVDTAWSSILQYYKKADISTDVEFVPSSRTGEEAYSTKDPSMCCGICLTDVNSEAKTNSSSIVTANISQLEYGGHVYHSACANLWVNCVDSSLPALAVVNNNIL